MNVYNVSELAEKNKGEYVLGSAELHSHACYLVYGVLKLDEKNRIIKPGKGHEEIVCLVQGEVILRGKSEFFNLRKGEAFHIKGEDAYHMENNGKGDVIYVIAGGHDEGHH